MNVPGEHTDQFVPGFAQHGLQSKRLGEMSSPFPLHNEQNLHFDDGGDRNDLKKRLEPFGNHRPPLPVSRMSLGACRCFSVSGVPWKVVVPWLLQKYSS